MRNALPTLEGRHDREDLERRDGCARSDEYLRYLEETGLSEYRRTRGNRGVYVLRRIAGGSAEFLLLTLWDSMEAIRRFAGPDPERAVYYPKDRDFLRTLEPTVSHFEVLVQPESPKDSPP